MLLLPANGAVPDGPVAMAVTECWPALRKPAEAWNVHPLLVKSLLPEACATSGRAPPRIALPTLTPSTRTVTLCTGAPVAVSAAHPRTTKVLLLDSVGFPAESPATSMEPISWPGG